jgi:hypothetical protein
MEAVDVLCGIDCAQHLVGIDLGRQRQLDEYAVDGIVTIECRYKLKKFCLGRIDWEAMLKGRHAGFQCLLRLRSNIDLACRIVADENNRKPRFDAACHQFRHVAGDSRP